MTLYTGRRSSELTKSNRNQPAITQGGVPATMGKKGYLARYIASRVVRERVVPKALRSAAVAGGVGTIATRRNR